MSDLLIFSHIEEGNSFDNLNIEYSESNLNFNNLFGDNKEYEAIVIGNNMAYIDQCLSVIIPFEWEVRFKESRRLSR